MTRLEMNKKFMELKEKMCREGIIEGYEEKKKELRRELLITVKSVGCELVGTDQVWFNVQVNENKIESFFIGKIEKSLNDEKTYRRYTLKRDYIPYSVIFEYLEEKGCTDKYLVCEGLRYRNQEDFENCQIIE